jgi:hypothetical protein
MTLEELERRIAALEREVALLKAVGNGAIAPTDSSQRGARMIQEARASQASLTALSAELFAKMGIVQEPLGAQKLQSLILASGIKPDENVFSGEIKKMREE